MKSEEIAEKKELLQKGKIPVISIVRTIRNLTGNRVKDLNLYQKIKDVERRDIVFLVVLPLPLWPIYFILRNKISKKMVFTKSERRASATRKEMLDEYSWIKRVIDSSKSREHLIACRNLIENWAKSTSNKIRECRCTFYRTTEITKTIDSYVRAKKELNILMAQMKVDIKETSSHI